MSIQRDKLERSLGGIAEMKKTPDMIFIIDTNVEDLAVKEAQKLNIPIVAIIDTNSNPTGINFPIPGNDDARRAINLYCELAKQTILDAQKNMTQEDELKKEAVNKISEDKKRTKIKETNLSDNFETKLTKEKKDTKCKLSLFKGNDSLPKLPR